MTFETSSLEIVFPSAVKDLSRSPCLNVVSLASYENALSSRAQRAGSFVPSHLSMAQIAKPKILSFRAERGICFL
jgi:hypothetical protein